MVIRGFIKSLLLKISDFVGYSLGFILPLRSIDSIRSKKLKVKRNNRTVFLLENFGPLSRKRARSFEFKEPETITWIESFDSKDTLIDILSGIRSACTYVGATRLKALSKCATFVRVNNTHNTIFGEE